MCRMQQFAWFNLSVIVLAVAVIASLFPLIGYRALGGLGFLGFIGLGPLFFRRTAGQVIADERDHLIHRRAWIFAYALYWVVFVLVAVFVSAAIYGEDGAVPVSVVRLSVAGAFMLVYALASIAILVQYAGGSRDVG
jgi:hypothetical protein